MDGHCRISPPVFVGLGEEPFEIRLLVGDFRLMPDGILRLRVEEDHVLDVPVAQPFEVFRVALDAGDVIAEIVDAEDAVHHHLEVMPDLVVSMEIDGAFLREQLLHEEEPFPYIANEVISKDIVRVGNAPVR